MTLTYDASDVPPGTEEQRAVLLQWLKLGEGLAALGPHRLAIAARAAVAAAGGGAGVGTEQENQIARWFLGIVDEAIARGGARAAAAIWSVLVGDSHPDPNPLEWWSGRSARCPAVAEVPNPPTAFMWEPGEHGPTPDPYEVSRFLPKLRTAAAGYVHTAIAGASYDHLRTLHRIMHASDDRLEAYRPWGFGLIAPQSLIPLDSALSRLTRRQLSNVEACRGVTDWAYGFAKVVAERAIPPVHRIGVVAWLARVALRSEGGAA